MSTAPHTSRSRLDSGLRRAMRYRGMLVLVLWQVPVQPVIGPNGSIGFMLGSGTDEIAFLSCDGSLLSSEPVSYRVAAVGADYNLSSRVRVDAVAGVMASDRASHDGGFGTVLLRSDWKSFGIGGGVAVSPAVSEFDSGMTAWPSGYLRVGSATGVHGRADLFPPTALAAQHIARLGIGYNAVQRDQPSGFIGLAGVGSDDGATGIAGELTVPVANRFAFRMEGHYASGHGHSVMGFAAGGRFLLGSATPVSATLRSDPPGR